MKTGVADRTSFGLRGTLWEPATTVESSRKLSEKRSVFGLQSLMQDPVRISKIIFSQCSKDYPHKEIIVFLSFYVRQLPGEFFCGLSKRLIGITPSFSRGESQLKRFTWKLFVPVRFSASLCFPLFLSLSADTSAERIKRFVVFPSNENHR